jgi:hypothetical protein
VQHVAQSHQNLYIHKHQILRIRTQSNICRCTDHFSKHHMKNHSFSSRWQRETKQRDPDDAGKSSHWRICLQRSLSWTV